MSHFNLWIRSVMDQWHSDDPLFKPQTDTEVIIMASASDFTNDASGSNAVISNSAAGLIIGDQGRELASLLRMVRSSVICG